MRQNLNLSFSGLYTAPSDYNGGPPGSCTVANNVECRYKNLGESRRGFDSLLDSNIKSVLHNRLTDFKVASIQALISRGSDGTLRYYNPSTLPLPWANIPGNFSTGLTNPNDTNAKSRFVPAGSNLYCTSGEGLRSLASGNNSNLLRAGVPKGLDLLAVTTGATGGFFGNNTVGITIGNVTSGSFTVNNLLNPNLIAVGEYVSGTHIPQGTTILAVSQSATILVEAANTVAGSTTITGLSSISGLVLGVLVTGLGVPASATIVSSSGSSAVISQAAYQGASGNLFTFSSPLNFTLSQAATGTSASESLTFYNGSQVGYRIVFGRIELDSNGNQITRLGAPSRIAYAINTGGSSTNVTLTATLPKNSSELISFYQIYRSNQTSSAAIIPLDQYQLVAEVLLTPSDFGNRTISYTDILDDANRGIPLYSGTDQEGPNQENSQPPLCWDMTIFRDFVLYANITRPTTLQVTILSVGPPNGLQIGDTIIISGNFGGVAYMETYTAGASEVPASRQFKVFTGGTASQNIADTAASLIRVINYDNFLPVHSLYISTSDNLPGQILLESDNPSYETFTATASAHTSAYDPPLTGVASQVNTVNNGIAISKIQELEAVPVSNLVYAGDQSADIIRIIALRDYCFIIKTDGVYRLLGLDPFSLVVNNFDLTVKIVGADTAVRLNSTAWMLSNQGVVSMSDAGVLGKSVPVDDQITALINANENVVNDLSFGIAYESDRKYILSVPNTSTSTYTETQFCFNYLTTVWTTWSRNLRSAYVNSFDNLLYISRADKDSENGISFERKNSNYTDYVEESFAVKIVSFVGKLVVLNDVSDINIGDILFYSDSVFSPILAVNFSTNTLTVSDNFNWTLGPASILPAIECDISWKQVFADNPAFARQYPEGVILFKNTRFNKATLFFETDYSNSDSSTFISSGGVTPDAWGLFPWGTPPWGQGLIPSNIRFLVPQDKQLGSYLIPSFRIRQAYSNWLLQGIVISYSPISQEVGLFQ